MSDPKRIPAVAPLNAEESHNLTQGLALAADLFTRAGELADGVRESALARGYSPTIAEQMAWLAFSKVIGG